MMGTFRKLAREATIFMLLGPVVVAPAVFAFLQRSSLQTDVKVDAARGVHAFDVATLPHGFRLDNSVLVPLSNGVQLYVTDCSQAHPIDLSAGFVPKATPSAPAAKKPSGAVDYDALAKHLGESQPAPIPIPPGLTNGSDCTYFSDQFNDLVHHFGGHLVSVPLGDKNQVAIEEEYWQAYAKAKSQHRNENMTAAAMLSLWGFPAGIIVWIFYRLVRFAVKG
jgi:hypothetical protein